tara:strand:- start:601 stop:888 length:288 start_codon:yes stop_codon:yes gene_type:complete
LNSQVSEEPPDAVEVYIWPAVTVATNFVPSADEATPNQSRLLSLAVHVTPESVEVYIWPPRTTAANFTPSEDDATLIQFLDESLAVHVTPESVEV